MISSAINRTVVALLLLLAAQETLRVNVSLVTVGVQVTDWLGRDVRGLKVANFSIFDNGVPQKIESFSDEEQPITLGIVLDRSDSMSYNAKLDRAKEAAVALVRSARDGSEYFYLPFDDHVKLQADLTSDPHQIETAIAGTTLGGGTALYDAVLEGWSRSGQKLTLIDGREVDNPRYVLRRLATDSGAEAFFPRSDKELAEAVRKIAHDLRTQYTLAFYPPVSVNDNDYHQLRVDVRGGRYGVRARPGYSTSSNSSSSFSRPAQPGQSQSRSD